MGFEEYIKEPSDFPILLGKTKPAQYIIRYLGDLKTKTCIIEMKYIDKDFMIDFQGFYVRAFQEIKKFTTRLHFFSNEFDSSEFETAIETSDEAFIQSLQDSYLGFVVIKPIFEENDKERPLIGRTLLKPYPTQTNNKIRRYLSINHNVSLFGIKLEINSIPFQSQDTGVSACATIALWTTLQTLKTIFYTPGLSPIEITKLSSLYPSDSRIFPQTEGLTLEQMINCIRELELDVEILNYEKIGTDDIINTAIKAFTNLGIPLIATLKIKDDLGFRDLHAVVITGYQSNSDG